MHTHTHTHSHTHTHTHVSVPCYCCFLSSSEYGFPIEQIVWQHKNIFLWILVSSTIAEKKVLVVRSNHTFNYEEWKSCPYIHISHMTNLVLQRQHNKSKMEKTNKQSTIAITRLHAEITETVSYCRQWYPDFTNQYKTCAPVKTHQVKELWSMYFEIWHQLHDNLQNRSS